MDLNLLDMGDMERGHTAVGVMDQEAMNQEDQAIVRHELKKLMN